MRILVFFTVIFVCFVLFFALDSLGLVNIHSPLLIVTKDYFIEN